MVTIPWMLLMNPYLQWKEEQNKQARMNQGSGAVELQ